MSRIDRAGRGFSLFRIRVIVVWLGNNRSHFISHSIIVGFDLVESPFHGRFHVHSFDLTIVYKEILESFLGSLALILSSLLACLPINRPLPTMKLPNRNHNFSLNPPLIAHHYPAHGEERKGRGRSPILARRHMAPLPALARKTIPSDWSASIPAYPACLVSATLSYFQNMFNAAYCTCII